MQMSERLRIEPAREDQRVAFTHLVPLVQALLDRGNRITKPGIGGDLFAPNPGGFTAHLADPIDWHWIEANVDLPESVVYDAAADEIVDRHAWVTIRGGPRDLGH
jgi:adenylate cyclase